MTEGWTNPHRAQLTGQFAPGTEPHHPVWNGWDELPSCRYDCRKTCENINMVDLLLARAAEDRGLDKGELVRSLYWMLNEMYEANVGIEDVRRAVRDGRIEVARKKAIEDVLEDLDKLLKELREA